MLLNSDDESTYTRKLHGFKLSAKEELVLDQLVKVEGSSESNLLRHGLRLVADFYNMQLEPGIFEARKTGNRTRIPRGKENRELRLTLVAV